jgi:Na+/H+ antiporter NhaD/arsenite permease-like protein
LVEFLENVLLFKHGSATNLLLRVCILSGILAPILTDEGCSLFLSTAVLDICSRYSLPFEPFALAIVTSANLGSGALILGNIKTLLGTEGESRNFVEFTKTMSCLVLVGLAFNTFVLWYNFHEQLDQIHLKDFLPKHLSPQLLAEDSQNRELDMDLMRVRQEYMDSKNIPFIEEDDIETALDSNGVHVCHQREDEIYIRDPSGRLSPSRPQLNIPVLSIQVSSPIPTPNHASQPKPEYCPEFTESPPDFPTYGDFENDHNEANPNSEEIENSPAQSFDEYHDIDRTYLTPSNDAVHLSVETSPLFINTSLPPPAPFLTIPTYSPSHASNQRCLSNYSVSSAYTIPTPTDPELITPYNNPNYFTFNSPSVYNAVSCIEDQLPSKKQNILSVITDPWFGRFLILLSFVAMYSGIMLGLNIGWTCFTTAIVISFIDNAYTNQSISDSLPCFDNINWHWLIYLLSIFPLIASIQNTPLPRQLWDIIKSITITKYQLESNPITGYLIFVAVVTVACVLITPVPALLIINPLIRQLPLPYSNHFDFLLIWTTIVVGNITPRSSLSGILVKEMYKTSIINQSWSNLAFGQSGDNNIIESDLHRLNNEQLKRIWTKHSLIFTPTLLIASPIIYWVCFC